MCEWCSEYQFFRNSGVYTQELLRTVAHVSQGRCPVCGSQLSHYEMYPAGRCSRSLCQSCYTKKFNRINEECEECGSDIRYKVSAQQQNWREIANHICDNPACKAKWALQHATVLGRTQQAQPHHVTYTPPVHAGHSYNESDCDVNIQLAKLMGQIDLQRQLNQLNQKLQQCNWQSHDPDIMDAEYVEVTPQPRAIPSPQRLQLPEPEPLMTVESLFGQSYRQPEMEVIEIDLTRKRKF